MALRALLSKSAAPTQEGAPDSSKKNSPTDRSSTASNTSSSSVRPSVTSSPPITISRSPKKIPELSLADYEDRRFVAPGRPPIPKNYLFSNSDHNEESSAKAESSHQGQDAKEGAQKNTSSAPSLSANTT
jgi:hypothetical protein